MSQRVNAAAPLAGRRPDQGRFAGDTGRTSHIVANPEMAPQPTCTSVNTSLSPSGVLLIKNNIRCSTATSATAMALLGRLDPTSPPPTCLEATHQLETATRPSVKSCRTPIPPPLCRFGFIPGCVNLTSIKSIAPLTGKTMPRLANKRFSQAYFCMSLFGSSSAGLPGPVRPKLSDQ
jgi:hypothetical protein